jgi:hypothetical protein
MFFIREEREDVVSLPLIKTYALTLLFVPRNGGKLKETLPKCEKPSAFLCVGVVGTAKYVVNGKWQ